MANFEIALLLAIIYGVFRLYQKLIGLTGAIEGLRKQVDSILEKDRAADRICGGSFPVFSKREIEMAYQTRIDLEKESHSYRDEGEGKFNDNDLAEGVKALKGKGKSLTEINALAEKIVQSTFEAIFADERHKALIQLNCDALCGKQSIDEARKKDPGSDIRIRVLMDREFKSGKNEYLRKVESIYSAP